MFENYFVGISFFKGLEFLRSFKISFGPWVGQILQQNKVSSSVFMFFYNVI